MEVRQITPGFFECVGRVQVDWLEAPPSVTGAGFQRTPVFGACGARFQVRAGLAAACGIPSCGRDSIGSCQGGCQRRLCGLHGSDGGSLVCAECAAGRLQREKQQREEANAATAARAADHHERLVDELRSARDAVDRLRCITAGDECLPLDLCVQAWMTVMASGLLSPSAELVRIEARRWRIGRSSWVEGPRVPAWKAMDAVWVDRDGECWTTRKRLNPNASGAGGGSGLAEGTYVVPLGHVYRTVSEHGAATGNQKAGYSGGGTSYSWPGSARVCPVSEAELNVDRAAAIVAAATASAGRS